MTTLTLPDIQRYLHARLGAYQIPAGTLTEMAREIGSLCGAVELKQFRIEYIGDGKFQRMLLFAPDELDAFREFHKLPESKDSIYLKCVPVE